jgi:chemotaxis protein histidine kinase CheA/CheY-like chemotaxis protein
VVDDPMIAALLDGFAAEAREIAQRITGNILALETEGASEADRRKHYDDLARGLHTLKGNASTFGFPHLSDLAHKMEDVVAVLRPTLATIPADTTDVLLRSMDVFMAKLAVRAAGDDPALTELMQQLGQHGAISNPKRTTTPLGLKPPSPSPAPGTELPQERTTEDWRIGPRHIEMLLREVERLRELRLRLEEQKREVERALRSVENQPTLDASFARGTLRSISRVLGAESEEANDIIDGLEQELKAVATLPLYSVLDPLQRAVRDLCRTLGKEARLAIVGAEISLDRRLLESLKGPLLHLVRNAVDHGIEPQAVRMAAGKHREGSISIRVERAGNLVVIEIEDDGAGMDVARIRETAIERNVLSADDAAALDERDVLQLVFRPAFSTRTEITETSGRGVGLDVVRAAVQTLGGHVELHTSLGSGSRFVLTLPVALGATPVLVVRVDEQTVGIPMIAIETLRLAKAGHVQVGRTTARFEHGGHLLPLYELGAILALRAAAPVVPDGRPVLILASRGTRIALAVDELIGDRELVVRPLPSELQDLPYQGAAIHARGDLLLVLQTDFLVEGRAASTSPVDAMRRALVVDDSLTARALHRTILESGGYQVHTVGSARQALDHLRHAFYDVVIADVMMPDIDGLEMTAMLRARPETRDLPLVLVSAHDTQPERERGLAAGADAFVSKKDCISGRLLGEVANVIMRKERGR